MRELSRTRGTNRQMKSDTDWNRTYVGLRQHGQLSSFLELSSQPWMYTELAGWLAVGCSVVLNQPIWKAWCVLFGPASHCHLCSEMDCNWESTLICMEAREERGKWGKKGVPEFTGSRHKSVEWCFYKNMSIVNQSSQYLGDFSPFLCYIIPTAKTYLTSLVNAELSSLCLFFLLSSSLFTHTCVSFDLSSTNTF